MIRDRDHITMLEKHLPSGNLATKIEWMEEELIPREEHYHGSHRERVAQAHRRSSSGHTFCLWFDKPEGYPLLKALHRAGHSLVICPGAMAQVLKDSDIPYGEFTVSDPRGPEKATYDLWKVLTKNLTLYDIGSWRQFVEVDFENMAKDLLKSSVFSLAAWEETIDKFPPKILIQSVDCRAEGRPLVDGAREMGVPSVQIAHGSLFDLHPYDVAGECTTLYSDRVFVWGEKDKDVLISYGANESDVIVTGSPYLDYLYKAKGRLSKHDARKKLGLRDDEIVISLWSSHPEPTFNWPDWLRVQNRTHWELVEFCKSLGARLLACPHPLEINPRAPREILGHVIDGYLGLVRGAGLSAVQVEIHKKTEAMIASDVCYFSLPSSAMVRAMILGVPVALAQGFPGAPECPFPPTSLRDVLTNRQEQIKLQNDVLPDWNYGPGATERVVQALQ